MVVVVVLVVALVVVMMVVVVVVVVATEIAQEFQIPVTVGKSQMAPVNAGPDQGSFPPKVPFSTPVSILL